MGLDSYLYAKKYISGYSFDKAENKGMYANLLEFLGIKNGEIQTRTPSGEIKLIVGYWRKANAIHKWFVNNVQDGVDECQSAYVTREKLKELLDVCKKVNKNHNLAKQLLPSESGFFFGSTDYDEYYFGDIERTIKQLESVLNNPKFNGWEFEYHASW